ncbi:hypothetical protein GRO01_11370 [Gluconobacter roseus NBRC 3990]|uniref:Uncharacterized protein n=1 Tax=Gluconobacter roseus NBRC 3990 TaxID=1307950 RepID=A0A4Y3M8G2_9PROT|nr:hypothetical protein GRO01_11370 [Gluconobacter roseus NBRC 3990]GLP94016.1 hypothetical protein GCM10007871_19940 [Gluconobacter roseus NBRC 3990]
MRKKLSGHLFHRADRHADHDAVCLCGFSQISCRDIGDIKLTNSLKDTGARIRCNQGSSDGACFPGTAKDG